MAQSKKTKKFEKSKLKDTLKIRKDFAKIKQRHQVAAKKKAKRAQDKDDVAPTTDKTGGRNVKDEPSTKTFEDMNVDEFFQAGIEVPSVPKKRKHAQDAPKTKKQKRSSDSDDDDDDVSQAESSDMGAQSTGLNGDDADSASDSDEDDLKGHMAQLDALAEKDPEFHKYLQDNDPELLELENADFDELELSDDDDDETLATRSDGKKKQKGKDAQNEVTKAMVSKWETAMKTQHSLRAAREVVLAFRAAANTSVENEKAFKYTISSPQVYHELLLLALNRVPDVLHHHLPVKESQNGKTRVPTESKKYSTITPLLKSHLTSVVYLMGHLSDAATLQLTLSSAMRCLPYILSFKRTIRELSRNAVAVWASAANTEKTRVSAFLVLRQLVVIGDAGIKEGVLRATYQGLVQGSRNTTVHTLTGINLMKNTASELWGLDTGVGYTTGFTFIRQLAIHLRNSITNNANESFRTVYNWQCIHSLDFWSRVLSAHCDVTIEAQKGAQSPLRPLIYPLVQVTLGAMRLIPSSTYFPLRFHLVRSLLRISVKTGSYIPLAAPLYEVLNSAEMRKAPKGSTLKALDFETSFRAPKTYLKTRVFQDGIGEQVAELLSEFLVLWTKSIAFPELALPIVVMLKRWLKEVGPHSKAPNQNTKISGVVLLLVQRIDSNCKYIEQARSKIDYAPKNRAGVEGFLKEVDWTKTPLGAFVAGQRKTREEKSKVVEQSRRDEEARKVEDRRRDEEERRAEAADNRDALSDSEGSDASGTEDEGDSD